MQADTAYAHRCPCCGKPRRIAHLLDLYERNYQLLERLIPELELPFERVVSKSASDLPLHLIVVERAPYTSELRLTYEFDGAEGKHLEPDLWIRVYRDARVAEALHCGARAPWTAVDQGTAVATRRREAAGKRSGMIAGTAAGAAQAMLANRDAKPDIGASNFDQRAAQAEAHKFLDDQWARNHTLAKWLEYLLEHGHGFSIAGRPRITGFTSR